MYNLNLNDIECIVNGWGVFDNQRVIVASVDNEMNLEIDKNVNLQIRFNGYNLYDPETFQVLDGRFLFVINTPNLEENAFSIKILIHQSNRLKV